MEHIRDHPGFNLADQIPEQLLLAAIGSFSIAAPVLLTLPGMDLNAPLSQHAISFPGRLSYLDPYMPARVIDHVRRGDPILFSMFRERSIDWGSVLDSPLFDVNQRGSHGQTVLFEGRGDEHFVWLLVRAGKLDLDVVDRHGNSALMCALISGGERIERYLELPFHFGKMNENGDTAWTLLKCRNKLTGTPPQQKVPRLGKRDRLQPDFEYM
jgi:hypothetical protein